VKIQGLQWARWKSQQKPDICSSQLVPFLGTRPPIMSYSAVPSSCVCKTWKPGQEECIFPMQEVTEQSRSLASERPCILLRTSPLHSCLPECHLLSVVFLRDVPDERPSYYFCVCLFLFFSCKLRVTAALLLGLLREHHERIPQGV
jgi:hypothetical protein